MTGYVFPLAVVGIALVIGLVVQTLFKPARTVRIVKTTYLRPRQPDRIRTSNAMQRAALRRPVAFATVGVTHETPQREITRSDLSSIERYLSAIESNTRSIAGSNPGSDIRAVVNRLESLNSTLREAVSVLNTIASNTRR